MIAAVLFKLKDPALGLAGLMLLFMAGSAGAAQTNAPATAPESVRLPLELKRGRVVVPARVHGSNSVWLMLDTGFSITMIDPRLADLLKLRRTGKTTITGIAGKEEADVFDGPTFDFAGATYTPRRVAALPSDRKRRARRMEGILGAGFFRRFVVELDFNGKAIQLHLPRDYRYSGAGEVLPLNLRSSTPVVEAWIQIPGRPAVRGEFEIDTGCDGGLCLGHDFVEANKLMDASDKVRGGGRAGVGGDAQTKIGSVPQLRLGRMIVNKPEANFFQQGSPVEHHLAGHIGIEVLRRFTIILDYSRQQMILESQAGQKE